MEPALRRLWARPPRAGAGDQAPLLRRASRRLGRRAARLSGRRQGHGDAQGVRGGDASYRAHRARAGRRLGRSRSVDVHVAQGGRRLRVAPSLAPPACRGSSAAAGATGGATSISACASTPWARRSTGSSTTAASSPSRRRFSSSRITCARSIRLAALAELHSIFVFTHDSIGVGEDGPTPRADRADRVAARDSEAPGHPALRRERDALGVADRARAARPADGAVLTRQHVPTLDRALYAPAEVLRRGAYVLNPRVRRREAPDLILIASGSEVALIVARRAHPAKGRRPRAAGLDAVMASVRGAAGGLSRERSARRGDGPARSRSRPPRSAGSAGRASGGRSSASTASGRRRRARPCSREYGFTVEHVVDEALALVGRRPQ